MSRASEAGPVRQPDLRSYSISTRSSLIRSVDGGPAVPPGRKISASQSGVGGAPTLLSNAETFAQLAIAARIGPERYGNTGLYDEPGTVMLTVSGAVHAGSLVATGKLPEDHLAGLLTGMDCSAVRYEQRRPWCIPQPGPAPQPPYCTRSLGAVDCWATPPPGAARGVADPPAVAEGVTPRPWGSPN